MSLSRKWVAVPWLFAGLILLAVAGAVGRPWERREEPQPREQPPEAGGRPRDAERPKEPDRPADAPLTAERLRCDENLREIAAALVNYRDTMGKFPPAVVRDDRGRPLCSWRVLILPYIEEEELFKEFRADEPWDGPNNRKLLARMPKVFRSPGDKAKEPTTTVFRACVGAGAAFEDLRGKPGVVVPGAPLDPSAGGMRGEAFADGLANTLLVVEAAGAVPWTAPETPLFDRGQKLPRMGGHFPEGFHAAFADGAVRVVPRDIDEKLLRALVSRAGKEKASRADLARELLQRGREPLYHGRTVKAWADVLGKGNEAARKKAVQALADAALDARGLPENDPLARAVAAAVLAAVGGGEAEVPRELFAPLRGLGPAARPAVPALLRTVRAGGEAGNDARQVLAEMGKEAVPALAAALTHDDYRLRSVAADVLGKMPSKVQEESVLLREALEQRYRRFEAAMALEKDGPGSREAILTQIESLEEFRAESSDHMASRAADTLTNAGDGARVAVAPMAEVPGALGSLGALGGRAREAFPVMTAALAGDNIQRGSDALTRLGAAAVPLLVELLPDSSRKGERAARVLGDLGATARPAVPALLRMLKHHDPAMRFEVAKALVQIGGPEAKQALPVLRELLAVGRGRQWDDQERLEVAKTILRLDPKDAEARAVLAPYLRSRHESLVVEAAYTLARVEPGHPAALVTLVRLVSRPAVAPQSPFLLDRNEGPGVAAGRLGELGALAKPAFAALSAPLRQDPIGAISDTRAAAVARIDPDAALPLLLRGLRGKNPETQVTAGIALGALGARAREAAPDLVRLIEKRRAEAEREEKENKDGFPRGFFRDNPLTGLGHALHAIDRDAALLLMVKWWKAGTSQPLVYYGLYPQLDNPGAELRATIPDLVRSLTDKEPLRSRMTGGFLSHFGTASVPALREALRGEAKGRAWAARVLGWIGRPAEPARADLLAALGDADAGVRREAAVALVRLRPDRKPPAASLWKAVKDRDAAVRREAVKLLGGCSKEGLPLAAEALKDEDPEVRWAAAGALGSFGADALPVLGEALKHKEATVRHIALLSLADVGLKTAGVVQALVAAARDADRETRRMAAVLLGHPDAGETAVPVLRGLLRDKVVEVRRAAASSLVATGATDRDTLTALGDAVKDADVLVARHALAALRSLGEKARPAVPLLREVLRDNRWSQAFPPDGPAVRGEAISLLVELEPQAADFLLRTIEPGPYAQHDPVGVGLLRLGEKAVPVLLRAMDGDDRNLRRTAALWLGRLAGYSDRVVPALAPLLGDENPATRLAALRGLGDVGPAARPAVPAIAKLLAGQPVGVKQEAVDCLSRIGPGAVEAAPALLDAMGDPELRDAAPRALHAIAADPKVGAALAERLKDRLDEPGMVELLRSFGPAGVPSLAAALGHRAKDVRKQACAALGELGPVAAPATADLAKVVERHRMVDGEVDVFWAAAEALGRIGPESLPPLLAVMKSNDAALRNRAVLALGQVGERVADSRRGAVVDEAALRKVLAAVATGVKDADEKVRASSQHVRKQLAPNLRLVVQMPDLQPATREAVQEALKEIDE